MEAIPLFGRDLFGEVVVPVPAGPLAARFEMPPFSILDGRCGEWRERKRAWLAMGIQSEKGRADSATTYNIEDWAVAKGKSGAPIEARGISVFDPVLCELAYKWFAPEGGQVIDPFAGGSVRGIVAAALGYRYWGCDLNAEQIAANVAQGESIIKAHDRPTWIHGDAMEAVGAAPDADLVFTCPPYGDLERYSDDPRDLSAMDYHAFTAALGRIALRCYQRLRADRFAAVVVGDFRCKDGFLRGFPADTIRVFRDAGFKFYTEAHLLTSLGTAAVRASASFGSGRKLTRVHQTLLVFAKGNPRLGAM